MEALKATFKNTGRHLTLGMLSILGSLALGIANVQAASEMYFIHNDHLGTPQVITDQNQAVVWQADKEPFGEADLAVEVIQEDSRFPGQYYDKETGYHYNYYRTYDPSIGRYMQSDPIGLAGGINSYGYALQNPLRYTDPFGLVSWECTSLSMGGSAAVFGAGIIRYRCESECINGSKTIAQIEVSYAGVNIGIEAGMVESRGNEINDNNSQPNPDVFNGEYFEAGANYTYGIGYGVSAVSWNRGQATGVNHGITGGIGIGAGEISGTSQVVSSRTVQCDDECN